MSNFAWVPNESLHRTHKLDAVSGSGQLPLCYKEVAVQSVRSVERGRFWLGLVCGEDGVIQEAFPIG
ncbi:MAG: hypothetical protein AAGB04_31220 [Pseudomonadota bacterium]